MINPRQGLALVAVLLAAVCSAAYGQSDDQSLQTWNLKHVRPSEVRVMLIDLLGNDAGVRIVADDEKNRLVVLGTAEVGQLTDELVSRVDRPGQKPIPDKSTNPPGPNRSVPGKNGPTDVLPNGSLKSALSSKNAGEKKSTGTHQFQLRNISTEQCEQALKKLLGDGLRKSSDGNLIYRSRQGTEATVSFDTKAQICRLSGDAALVDQLQALLNGFELSQDRSRSASIRFVPLRKVRPEILRRAIEVWKSSAASQEPEEGPQSARNPQDPFRMAGLTQVEAESDTDSDELRRPASDIRVQPLPDLDAIILEGRDTDVEELIRIIQEIERLSEETAPEIEIYQLKHVQGEALDTLIDRVLEDLTQPLQGRVSITPLGTPNALLLIGWGEAVEAAKKLISKLDVPTDGESQMKIFELKNAPSGQVAATIRNFLSSRGGLSPNVNVTPNSRTNSVIVNASPRDMEEVARLVEHLDLQSGSSVNQGKLIRLKNTSATRIAETIREAIQSASGSEAERSAVLEILLEQPDGERVVASGTLEDVKLTPDAGTNSILITGPKAGLELVERLIVELDQSPASKAMIRVFEVAKGDATDMVQILRSLFPAVTSGSTVPQLPTAGDDGEGSLVPVRFSVDVRSNTIIATGSASDLRVVEAILLRLDEADSQERVNRVYRLKNSPAVDVAQAVNEFLRSERVVARAAPGRQNPFEQIEQEVVVVPEIVRNTLIVSATPRYIDQIMELIEELDDQPPQVVIQVILAEVDLNNFHEFGVELGLQDSLLFDRSLLGELLTTTTTSNTSTPAGVVTTTSENIIGASNEPGFDFNNKPLGNSGSTRALNTSGKVGGQALSHFSLGRVNSELDYGGLVLSASSENVSVLLRALHETGSMEVISRPQITTLDNQQAYIQVGQRVPRISGSTISTIGQNFSITEEDVGILLLVTPRVNADGNVVMEIDAEKSAVGPEREGIPISTSADGTPIRAPIIDVTRAQTTVSAASGQTIVIGGLITTDHATLSRKVPWLGDLPVVGNLFRYDGFENNRTELLIILTPRVIRGQADMEYLKQVEMARMSWVCSDVFEFLDGNATGHGIVDDTGVPIYYPDQDPVLQTVPSGESFEPLPDPNMSVPGEGVPVIPRETSQNLIVEPPGDATQISLQQDRSDRGRSRVIPAGNSVTPDQDGSAETTPTEGRTLFGWKRDKRK